MQGAQIGAGGLSPLWPLTLTIASITSNIKFDTQLVSTIILGMKGNKVPDIDGLTAEHHLFSRPCTSHSIKVFFFNLIFSSRYISLGL